MKAVGGGYALMPAKENCMLEENEVVWVQDGFTGAWEPLESFTVEEMNALPRED